MANPQILDLDGLLNEVKQVQLDGVNHVAVEQTVEVYLKRVARANQIKQDDSPSAKTEQSIEFLTEVYPTITADRFRKLTLTQLGKLIEFTMAAPQDIVAAAEAQNQTQPGNA